MVSVLKAIANPAIRDVPKTAQRIGVKLGRGSSPLSWAASVLTQGQETISATQANEGTSKG